MSRSFHRNFPTVTLHGGGNHTLLTIRNLTAVAFLAAVAGAPLAYADSAIKKNHVLLISIDGMHAVDYAICAKNNTCPNMAKLASTGVNYTRTSTSRPSD